MNNDYLRVETTVQPTQIFNNIQINVSRAGLWHTNLAEDWSVLEVTYEANERKGSCEGAASNKQCL